MPRHGSQVRLPPQQRNTGMMSRHSARSGSRLARRLPQPACRRPGTPPSLHADPGRVAQLVGGIAGHVLRGRGQSVCVVERTDVSNVDADVAVRASGVVAVGVGLMDGEQCAGGVDHAHVVLYCLCHEVVVVSRAPHYHVTHAQPRELAGSDEEEIFGVGREQAAAPASRPRHILRHVQQRVVA